MAFPLSKRKYVKDDNKNRMFLLLKKMSRKVDKYFFIDEVEITHVDQKELSIMDTLIDWFMKFYFSTLQVMSMKLVLFTAFFSVSFLSIFVLNALQVKSIKDSNEVFFKHSSDQVSKLASLLVTNEMSHLSEKFIDVVREPSSFYTTNINVFDWLGASNVSNLDSRFSTLYGYEGHRPSSNFNEFSRYVTLAKENAGEIIYSNRSVNMDNYFAVYLLYVKPNDLSKVMIASLNLEYIKELQENISLKGDEVFTIVDGVGEALISSGSPSDSFSTVNEVTTSIVLGASSVWGLSASSSHTHLSLIDSAESISNKSNRLAVFSVMLFLILSSCLITRFILKPVCFLGQSLEKFNGDSSSCIPELRKIEYTRNHKNIYFVEVIRLVDGFKKLTQELFDYHENMEAKIIKRQQVLESQLNERERVAKQIGYVSSHDSLTGLANEKLFLEFLGVCSQWSKFVNEKPSLIVIYIEGLECTKDKYSSIVSDSMLKSIAESLSNFLPKNVILARTNPFEFSILLVDINTLHDLSVFADSVRVEILEKNACLASDLSGVPDIPLDIRVNYAMIEGEVKNNYDFLNRARGVHSS